ncbi:hypothetical protein [Cloacibacillus porcorum]|uniref:hypothetical protein n=1 Tax=Cloacibacillus porcorum TaxID=1197717 RepID=UPI003D065BE4
MQGPFYNRYNSALSPEERQGLYERLMDMSMSEGRNRYNDMNDYDMAGAYLAGAMEPGGNGHFTDEFKKPNHPTFSTESRYNGVDGYSGGVWSGDEADGVTFTPSEWNLKNMPPEEMQRYFGIAEPDARLVLPGNGGGNKDMAVKYVQNGGGGLWDSIIPKALSLGGMALGGPVGGLVGNFAGNMATGQSFGQAAGNTAMSAANQYGGSMWDENSLWNKQMNNWRDRRSF